MLFGTLIKAARAREREAGVDHRELACYATRLTPYVQSHLSETLRRLQRLYVQLPPAPIEEARQRPMWEKYRPEFVRGLAEVLDDMATVLAAVGCTEEELEGLSALVTRAASDPVEPADESSCEETAELPRPAAGEGAEKDED